MTSREEVQERIRRAQLAILNPSVDHASFLTAGADAQFASRTFSQNCVIVELSGKTLSDLNFVDLPGALPSAMYSFMTEQVVFLSRSHCQRVRREKHWGHPTCGKASDVLHYSSELLNTSYDFMRE